MFLRYTGPVEYSRYPAPPIMSGMDKDRRELFQPPMGSYPRPPGPGYQGPYQGALPRSSALGLFHGFYDS